MATIRARMAGGAGRAAGRGHRRPGRLLGRVAGHHDWRAAGRGRAQDHGRGVRPGRRPGLGAGREPRAALRFPVEFLLQWDDELAPLGRGLAPFGSSARGRTRCMPIPAVIASYPASSWTAQCASLAGISPGRGSRRLVAQHSTVALEVIPILLRRVFATSGPTWPGRSPVRRLSRCMQLTKTRIPLRPNNNGHSFNCPSPLSISPLASCHRGCVV